MLTESEIEFLRQDKARALDSFAAIRRAREQVEAAQQSG
jgi:hypothetical protein